MTDAQRLRRELRRINREIDTICAEAIAVSMDEQRKANAELARGFPYALARLRPDPKLLAGQDG